MIAIASPDLARPATTEARNNHKTSMHMTFFWGHKTVVLFPGWPGSSTGMYILALAFVFSLAVIVEWLSYSKFVKPGTSRVAAGLFKTGLQGVRAGLVYMLMLAVMSFNGGIFIAAVLGHAVGYLLFGTRVVFHKSDGSDLNTHNKSGGSDLDTHTLPSD